MPSMKTIRYLKVDAGEATSMPRSTQNFEKGPKIFARRTVRTRKEKGNKENEVESVTGNNVEKGCGGYP